MSGYVLGQALCLLTYLGWNDLCLTGQGDVAVLRNSYFITPDSDFLIAFLVQCRHWPHHLDHTLKLATSFIHVPRNHSLHLDICLSCTTAARINIGLAYDEVGSQIQMVPRWHVYWVWGCEAATTNPPTHSKYLSPPPHPTTQVPLTYPIWHWHLGQGTGYIIGMCCLHVVTAATAVWIN